MDLIISSVIQSTQFSGGTVVKEGEGSLILTAQNTFGTFLGVNSGSFQLGTPGGGAGGSLIFAQHDDRRRYGTAVFVRRRAVGHGHVDDLRLDGPAALRGGGGEHL